MATGRAERVACCVAVLATHEMNGSENLFLNLGQLSDLLRTR